jgi:hypothetical protein
MTRDRIHSALLVAAAAIALITAVVGTVSTR